MICCPECGHDDLEYSISEEWLQFTETPARCLSCDHIVWVSVAEDHGGVVLDQDQIPPFELGFKVRVIDEHSVLYGKEAFVIDKDHIHYRVKSGNTLLWVPEHWVERA